MPHTVLQIPAFEGNPYQQLLASALASLGIDVKTVPRAASLLRPAGAAAIHIHWLHVFCFTAVGYSRSAPTLLAALAKFRATGGRIVWTVHNLSSHERVGARRERLLGFALGRLATAIVVHSPGLVDQAVDYFRLPRHKVHVIPHGHYGEFYRRPESREEARRSLDLDPAARLFLAFGEMRRYKGIPDLIDAFGEVQAAGTSERPNRLLLAGRPEASFRDDLLARVAQDRIRLDAEYIADERLPSYFAAADVTVFPYRKMLTSGAVILAMSFGRAVIAPRRPFIADVLDESGGFLYDPDDPTGLSTALAAAARADDATLTAMGQRNLAFAKTHLDWTDIARRLAGLYGIDPIPSAEAPSPN